MSNPLVTVAVFSYNQEDFIAKALDSVLAQTYSNIEIIVCDDASQDKTPEILKQYAKKYPDKVKLQLHSENLGITDNCRSSVPLWNGKYILLLGGDDMYHPQKVERQLRVMEAYQDCVLCYHEVEVFDSDTDRTLYYFNDKLTGLPHYEGDILDKLLLHRCFISGLSAMMRTDCITVDSFDRDIPKESDWLLFMRVCSKGKAIYIDKVLGRYRRHSGNVTNTTTHEDAEKAYDIILRELPAKLDIVHKGKSYLYLMYCIKYIVRKDWNRAIYVLNKFLSCMALNPSALIFICSSLWSEIPRRLIRIVRR